MSRDKQFQNFAKLLVGELFNDDVLGDYGFIGGRQQHADLNYDLTVCEEIIARRAYDLACHVVENVSAYNVSSIPDMTELPKDAQ